MFRLVVKNLLVVLVIFLPNFAYAEQLIFAGGDFGVRRKAGEIFEFRAEYRWDEKFWKIRPLIGGLVTTKASKFIYVGAAIYHDFGDKITGGLSLAPGYYSRGSGKDLGCSLEFKSQAELWYNFRNNLSTGIAVSHISNAGLSNKNPGQESIVLQISIPF